MDRLRVASAESAFRNEKEDQRWSVGAAADVHAALAQIDPSVRSHLRSVECRSQSCRMEIGADASEPLRRDLPVILAVAWHRLCRR